MISLLEVISPKAHILTGRNEGVSNTFLKWYKKIIIQFSSTVYRDHEGWHFLPKIAPQNQLFIHFVISRQYWL